MQPRDLHQSQALCRLVGVSDSAHNDGIPPWELHHRLARALEWQGVTAEEMAVELGQHVNSVYNYASGRRVPKRSVIRVWALRCGVPFDWLEHGDPAPVPPNTPASECYQGYRVLTRQLVPAA